MSNLPITFTDKVNSPELLAFLQAYGEDKYLTAEEINQIRDGINSLFNLTGAGSGITNNTGFNFVGTNLIFNQFFSWKFLGVETVLDENFSIPVPYADANKHRTDLIVARNGFLVRIPGLEYDLETPAPEPLYDSSTDLRITAFEVNESDFGDTSDVIIGDAFVKKSFSQGYVYADITGADASIPIPASGASQIVLSNASLTSIACLDLTAIIGNLSAEAPYPNKIIEITNSTGNDIELKHATGSGIQFFTKDGLSIIIPNKESLYVKYNSDGAVEAFRSWSSVVPSDNYFTYESAGFKVNVTAGLVNIWLRNNQYVQYDLYFDESTGITDKSLIIPDVRSVVYKVPQDCFLEELSIRRPPAGNGKVLIWKTASDSVSSTPIEILYKLIDNTFAAGGGLMGSVFYGENIPLLKGEYLHFFFTADINTAWWNKIFIRFKKQ